MKKLQFLVHLKYFLGIRGDLYLEVCIQRQPKVNSSWSNITHCQFFVIVLLDLCKFLESLKYVVLQVSNFLQENSFGGLALKTNLDLLSLNFFDDLKFFVDLCQLFLLTIDFIGPGFEIVGIFTL